MRNKHRIAWIVVPVLICCGLAFAQEGGRAPGDGAPSAESPSRTQTARAQAGTAGAIGPDGRTIDPLSVPRARPVSCDDGNVYAQDKRLKPKVREGAAVGGVHRSGFYPSDASGHAG